MQIRATRYIEMLHRENRLPFVRSLAIKDKVSLVIVLFTLSFLPLEGNLPFTSSNFHISLDISGHMRVVSVII